MPLTPPLDTDEDNNYKQLLMQQLQMQNQAQAPDNTNNALFAGLNQSAAKLGTVGGRVADTGDVTRYADILDKSRAARQNQDMEKTGAQAKILASLAQLKDKSTQLANSQAFDLKKLGIENQNKLALEKVKNTDNLASGKTSKPTEAQSNSATFAVRAKDAGTLADRIEKEGYDPATYSASARKTKLPIVGQYFAKDEDRSYEQAKTDFITAVLRKESGATISDPEFAREEAKYFPAPGDSAQLKAQKAASRARAVDTLVAAGGNAYDASLQQPFAYKKPEPTPETGSAYAASPPPPTPTKELDQMSDAELDAELARLKGK